MFCTPLRWTFSHNRNNGNKLQHKSHLKGQRAQYNWQGSRGMKLTQHKKQMLPLPIENCRWPQMLDHPLPTGFWSLLPTKKLKSISFYCEARHNFSPWQQESIQNPTHYAFLHLWLCWSLDIGMPCYWYSTSFHDQHGLCLIQNATYLRAVSDSTPESAVRLADWIKLDTNHTQMI